jgi:hypothetical protein
MGRANLPHVYLLDNDRYEGDKTTLRGTTRPMTEEPVRVQFLKRYELENYLLDPEAITAVITDELRYYDERPKTPTMEDVRLFMEEMLDMENADIYPLGKREPFLATCKGSIVLSRIFTKFDVGEYRKTQHGPSIARRIAETGGLQEIWEVVADIFA